jgi:hypothetical protein
MNKPQNISRQEMMKIKESFAKPEFQNLLSDYMYEISEPKNLNENNEYLLQLEKEGQLPPNMKLISPNPVFVISSDLASNTDGKFSQKIYINIGCHDSIDTPNAEFNSVKNGSEWKIPYRCGKLRLDQDQNSSSSTSSENIEIVSVLDIVFNPETIVLIKAFSQIEKMVCDIALSASKNLIKEKDQVISNDYKIEKNMEIKGVAMGLLLVPKSKKELEENPQRAVPTNVKDKPDIYYDLIDQQQEFKQKEKQTVDTNDVIESVDEEKQPVEVEEDLV